MSDTTTEVTAQGSPATEPGDDLRSIIGAAWDEAEQQQDTGDGERARDERGRFAATAQETDDAPTDDEPDQPEAKADEPAEEPAIDPPQSWSADEKAIWSTLSDAAKAAVIRREREIDRALSERAPETQDVREFRQVAEAYRDQIAEIGAAPSMVLKNAITWDRALRTDPVRALSAMARQYGIDLAQISQAAPEQLNAPIDQTNPQIAHLHRRIAELEAATAQERQMSTAATIEAFETAKDASGALRHPYFAEVRVDMGRLITADPTLSLEQAYDKAIWANPETRGKLRAAEAAAEKAKADAARKAAEAKASAARRAAASVRDGGVPRNGTAGKSDGSVRSDILIAIEEVSARL